MAQKGATGLDWDKLQDFSRGCGCWQPDTCGRHPASERSRPSVDRSARLRRSLNTTLFPPARARADPDRTGGTPVRRYTAIHVQTARRRSGADTRFSEEEVFGELRVTTTIGFGSLWLAPRLPALYEKYPDLKIDLMLEERLLDLPMREADVAIRMKEPSQADLIRTQAHDRCNMALVCVTQLIIEKPTATCPRRSDDIAAITG